MGISATAARPAVLELGKDVGAAVIYAKSEDDGAELEIKRYGSEWNGLHTAIRQRPGGPPGSPDVYAALFFGLPAGRYELRLRGRSFGGIRAIDIVGGRIAELALYG